MLALPDLIECRRVSCRAWTTDDQAAMSSAIAGSLEHLRPWLPFVAAEPLSVDQRLALIEAMAAERAEGQAFHYGIFQPESTTAGSGSAQPAPDPLGPVLGGVGLHRRSDRSFEIGYWIRVDQVGKHLASEVVRACVGAAFELTDATHIALHHDRANAASGGVARSCGFDFVTEGQRARETPGETGIDWEWRMTRERWHAVAPASPEPVGNERSTTDPINE